MAKSILLLLALLSISAAVTKATPGGYGRHRHEKLTHLHFYIHDTPVAAKPSAVVVAQATSTKTSATLFGQVSVVDDPMTEMPDLNSTSLGRVQGMYAFTSQSEASLAVFLNIVFMDKKYNGSTISFLGQDPLALPVREMPIVGGTGVFRFARGYVEFRTIQFDPKTGNAILDVNVYALHY